MKKLFDKINNNKLLFTIFIVICFILFDFLTNGIGIWDGLLGVFHRLFDNIYNYTYYGAQFVGEIFWLLLLLPIILIFKNTYIFKQKGMKLIPSLLVAWPVIIYTIIALISSLIKINVSYINFYEVFALLLLTLTVGLFEEFLCRGWLQNEFIERFGQNRKGVIYSIIVSGSIFGIMHITNLFYGQDLFSTIIQIMSALITGISFGAIYYKTKNIWSVVILHGLWDFAVFFAGINATSTCAAVSTSINTITPILGILSVFAAAFTSIPEWGTAIMILGKNDINMGLDQKYRVSLTEEELKHNKTIKIVMSIILGIFLVGYLVLTLFMGNPKSDNCPTYISKDVNNYSEKLYNYNDYNLIIEKSVKNTDCDKTTQTSIENMLCEDYVDRFNFNFKIDDDYNLIITNVTTGQNITSKYKNVFNFAIVENNGIYDVLILSGEDNGNVITYRSNFISANNISNNLTYLNEIDNSFKQVMLPATINEVGYYQEKNNDYRYPLFISSTSERYIISLDGTIYKYK